MTNRYDVVFWDTIGGPIAPSFFAERASGASEHQVHLIAEGLAQRGRKVLVLHNGEQIETSPAGVEYVPWRRGERSVGCEVLVIHRYSTFPPASAVAGAERVFVLATDMPGAAYDHHAKDFRSGLAKLICLSNYQAGLFPNIASVMPYAIPERVFTQDLTQKDPLKFVFASAPPKGLPETLREWTRFHDSVEGEKPRLEVFWPWGEHGFHGQSPSGVVFRGGVTFDALVEELRTAAALFYVNTWPETFCVTVALAQALRCRTHVLCVNDFGALAERHGNPYITDSPTGFRGGLADGYWHPMLSQGNGEAKYKESAVLPLWDALLMGGA